VEQATINAHFLISGPVADYQLTGRKQADKVVMFGQYIERTSSVLP
jgi:S-adenosylmethionine synthetase